MQARGIPFGLRWVAWLCAVAAAWIILPAQFAGWSLLGELMVHWTAHAVALLVIPLVIWHRQRGHCLALLVLIGLGSWPWWIAAWSARSQPSPDSTERLQVASFNLQISNPALAASNPAVISCNADVLVLIEVDALDEHSLRHDPRWPFQRWVPIGSESWRGLGLAMLSRQPVDAFVVHDHVGYPVIAAHLNLGGKPLTVIAVHPRAPVSVESWQLRDQQFAVIAGLARGAGGPVVALGDWNSSAADPAWRRLLDDSGLRRAGGHAPATWPSIMGPLGIAIDHVLAGNGAQVANLRSVELPGSDHRGISATITLR